MNESTDLYNDVDTLEFNLACAEAYIKDLEGQLKHLVSIVESAAVMIRKCDYTPARSLLLTTVDHYKDKVND